MCAKRLTADRRHHVEARTVRYPTPHGPDVTLASVVTSATRAGDPVADRSAGVPGPSRHYAVLLIVSGLLGLTGALALTIDRIRLLEKPDTVLECTLNSAVNCASVMTSWQGSVFGFPNPLMGIVGFSGLVVVGCGLLGGARYPRWMWAGLGAGTLFGAGFVAWLIGQSVFAIQRLCPWCMLVWAVMVPVLVSTASFLLANVLPAPEPVRRAARWVRRWYALTLIVLYAVIAGLIAWRFGLSVFGV